MDKRTIAIHGKSDYSFKKGVDNPINLSSTFYFDSIKDAEDTFEFRKNDYVYSRGKNPTLDEFEEKMRLLEEGEFAISFASGMGAISTTLLGLLKPNDTLLFNSVIYGSSHNLFCNILTKYGIKAKSVNLKDLNSLKNNIDSSVKVVYFETPANPTLDIIDIAGVREVLGSEILIVVDNTFATPVLQQPLIQGADFVIHSATKYIGGHGDALGGVLIGKSDKYHEMIRFGYMCEMGGVLSPFNAWLFNRGLKTLYLRMENHSKSAYKIALFLEGHLKIKKVYYPGLKSFKGYEIAKRQMKSFGGMISFEVQGTDKDACKVVENLKIFKIAVSLGDIKSLVEHPMKMTHRDYSEEERAKLGIKKSLIRISVGLEDVDDLIEDLENSLGII